jgi:hypothetical protein
MRCADGLIGGPEGFVVIGALATGDATVAGEGEAAAEAAGLAGAGELLVGLATAGAAAAGWFVGATGADEVHPTTMSMSTSRPGFIHISPRAADQATVPYRHASARALRVTQCDRVRGRCAAARPLGRRVY